MFEFVIAIIAFLGLYVGRILALVTKDELIFGRKYFIFLEKAIFSIFILFLLYFSPFSVLLVVGLFVGFLSSYILRKSYVFFGCALAAAKFIGGEIFVLFASLIFIFGLVHSSLSRRIIMFNAFIFFIPYIIFFSSDNIGFLTGFVVGGLVNFLK